VKQTLKALVYGDRLELMRDYHTHKRSHSSVHAARWSADVYDSNALVLNTTHTLKLRNVVLLGTDNKLVFWGSISTSNNRNLQDITPSLYKTFLLARY